MEEVQIKAFSAPLFKALRRGSQNSVFASSMPFPTNPNVLTVEPPTSAGVSPSTSVMPTPGTIFMPMGRVPSGDGTIPISMGSGNQGFASGPGSLFLIPYCMGVAGNRWSMRLFGWREIKAGNLEFPAWIPYLLVELACTASDRCGPNRGVNSGFALSEADRLAEVISVVAGNAAVVSPGRNSNLIASAVVPLGGTRLVSFDFQQLDPVPMNCLYARA